VDPADFAAPAWEETGWRTSLGAVALGLGTVGVVATVVFIADSGVGALACICISIPLIGSTLFLLVAGVVLIARDERGVRSGVPAAGGDGLPLPDAP
jgi:hypothetical protein